MDLYEYPTRFGDFVEGAVIGHEQTRVVTEADNLLFSRMSGHEHPLVFSYGREGPTPAIVNPFLVLAIVGGLAVRSTSQNAIANLGWEYVRFPARVFVGEELRAVTKILGKRISKSNPSRGVITIITYGVVGDRVVSEANRSFLVFV